jgi:hypothetical protein
MLDERITRFVQDAVRIRAREFNQDLATRLLQVDSDAAKAGQMGGSGRAKGYAVVFRQDLRNRAHYIFIEIQRALGLYPQLMDETLRNYLVGLHFTEVRKQCNALHNLLEQGLGKSAAFGDSSLGSLLSRLNDECAHLQEKYTLEMGAFFQASLRSKPVPESNGSVVINGPVGVVQTGAYASATLIVNVGVEDRGAMIMALEMVASTFRDSQQLADEHRRQMLEVVDQAKVATQQQLPNPTLLRGMFTVVCETLQTLAASQPAMAALRAAALPFGIAL